MSCQIFQRVPGVLLCGGQGRAIESGVFGLHCQVIEFRQSHVPKVERDDFGVWGVFLIARNEAAGDFEGGRTLLAWRTLNMEKSRHGAP
ncbi:hypothetical protein D3C84_518850 [compost metagenome]